MFRAGTAPDVMIVAESWVSGLSRLGGYADLSSFVRRDGVREDQQLGRLDTHLPLTVPSFLGVGCAFYIFLLRQFFLGIPKELFEAARVDGAGRPRPYIPIALPLAKPALITDGLFRFVASWNDFFGPLIFLSNSSKFTLPVGIRFFQSLYQADSGTLMAASCLTLAPVMLLFLLAQKFFVQVIATTGGKA